MDSMFPEKKMGKMNLKKIKIHVASESISLIYVIFLPSVGILG